MKSDRPRSLRRRMALQIGLMIAASLMIALGALWGIRGLGQDFGAASEGYRALRAAYEIGSRVELARALLDADRASVDRPLMEVMRAEASLRAGDGAAPPALEAAVAEAVGRLKAMDRGALDARALSDTRRALNHVLSEVADASTRIRLSIDAHERNARAKRDITLAMVAGLSLVAIAGLVIAGVRHYRNIIRPLDALRSGAHRLASGEFSEGIVLRGDLEFVRLAEEFNRMAAELRGFYEELERKVQTKSRELARSARLASIGYLAAGVAHEINNPLGIIAGYGERALRQLSQLDSRGGAEGTEKALRIICDEAFRCKEITDRLLSLARPEEQARREVDLAEAARSMLSNLTGLPAGRDRRLSLEIDPNEDLRVLARENEMKQVLLNLSLNAIEATAPGGAVTLACRREGDEVVFEVIDDGQGMTREAIERVFEPFFTSRRGAQRHGTGLGLSITQAIVEEHEGSIQALSDGPDRGSCFAVRLPAFRKGGAHVA